MPRIIVKCRYYSSAKSFRDIGGMLKYIATRDGVDKPGDGWREEPTSKAQQDIIAKFCEAYSGCKRLKEYSSYMAERTKGAASEFISAALENYPYLLSDKTYLDYIATRPRAERIAGKHGLFTSHGISIDLENEAENVRQHDGNVFSIIISLKRHDAERLGYNNAERWKALVQSCIEDIAKEYKIPCGELKWFGAFHNESHHPHIHLLLYSTDKYEKGFITKKGIDNLRHLFGTEIFADDLDNYYKEQTKYRNWLNASAYDEIAELADKIQNGFADDENFSIRFVALAKRLQSVKGKKVFGYLPKNVKAMVNELVDALEKNEDIQRAYELWYQAKCAVYATYTDNPPPKKPLSQEEAFKPIRNAMIKEADDLGKLLLDLENKSDDVPYDEETHKSNETSEQDGEERYACSTSTLTKNTFNSNAAQNGYIAASITRFGNSLSRIFRDRFDEQAKDAPIGIDSRLEREIEAKKKGQNVSM